MDVFAGKPAQTVLEKKRKKAILALASGSLAVVLVSGVAGIGAAVANQQAKADKAIPTSSLVSSSSQDASSSSAAASSSSSANKKQDKKDAKDAANKDAASSSEKDKATSSSSSQHAAPSPDPAAAEAQAQPAAAETYENPEGGTTEYYEEQPASEESYAQPSSSSYGGNESSQPYDSVTPAATPQAEPQQVWVEPVYETRTVHPDTGTRYCGGVNNHSSYGSCNASWHGTKDDTYNLWYAHWQDYVMRRTSEEAAKGNVYVCDHVHDDSQWVPDPDYTEEVLVQEGYWKQV